MLLQREWSALNHEKIRLSLLRYLFGCLRRHRGATQPRVYSVRVAYRYILLWPLEHAPRYNPTSSFLKWRTRNSVRPCSCIPTVAKADRTSLSYRRNVSLPEQEPAKASTISTLIEEGKPDHQSKSRNGLRAQTSRQNTGNQTPEGRQHRTAQMRKFPFEWKVRKVGPTFS